MSKLVRILAVLLLLSVTWYGAGATPTAAPNVVEKITLYGGQPAGGLSQVTFDGQSFTVPGHEAVPKSGVQWIDFSLPEQEGAAPQAAAAATGLTPLAQAQLEKATATAQRYPGISGIVLVDDGVFEYHKDGTHNYRYQFAGLVLKEDKKAWAQVSEGFTEGRSRVRILYARSVNRDGSVTALTPDMLKVSSPSEEVQFFNPTQKVLSGVIPGVEVGSIVEYSYEHETYNPEDPRLFSPGFSFQGMEPVAFSRVKVSLPKNVALQYVTRHFADPKLEKPVVETSGDVQTYTWQLEDMPPISPEPLMPPEPDVVPMMEGSIFKDFNEVFALLRGLQEARIQRTPEIDAKVNEIVKDAGTIEEKLARIYYWVQENTRYISIKGSLGAGFSGHTAEETYHNRYGDCTDKSILFCTMLQSIGVSSYPIILHTNDSGTAITEIPTLSGNHCITEVCLNDRSFYLDSTAEDYRYPYFRADDHGALAFNAIRGDIKTIPVPPPADNRRQSHLEVALASNGDATVRTRNNYTGSIEAGVRGFWKRVREDNRKPMMTEYVNSISPGALLQDFTLSNLEDLAAPLRMTIDYALPGAGIRAKDLMYLKMPTLEREYPEVALETRHYPIQYMTTEERLLEIDLALPPGFRAKWLPPPLEVRNAYVECRAGYEERGGHILFHETFRRLQRIVPVNDYAAYRDALGAIAAFSKQEIFLTQKG